MLFFYRVVFKIIITISLIGFNNEDLNGYIMRPLTARCPLNNYKKQAVPNFDRLEQSGQIHHNLFTKYQTN